MAIYGISVKKNNVTFKCFGERIGQVQKIVNNKDAIAPIPVEKEGYVFVGWDKDFTNVTSDLEVKAVFEKVDKELTVTFLDYRGDILTTQKVEYFSNAQDPELKNIAYYEFIRWDQEFERVTEDLIISLLYNKNVLKFDENLKQNF